MGTWRLEIPTGMVRLHFTDGYWQELLDGLTNQLAGRPAVHRFERTIRRHDHAVRIHRHDPLGGSFQQKPQFAIVFLVAARLQSLLCTPAFGDVEADSSDSREPPICITFRSANAMHPAYGAVRPHDAERLVPVVVVRTAQHVAQVVEYRLAVILVQRRAPRFETTRTSRGQAVMGVDPFVPVETIGPCI